MGQRLTKELSASLSNSNQPSSVPNLPCSPFPDSVPHIPCSLRSSGPSTSLTTNGLVAGRQCQVTIDTGSNITLVRPDVLSRPGKRVTIQPAERQLRTVTGEIAPVCGICTEDITIGNFCASHHLWVADITDECILGLDFLRKHEGLLNLKDDVLQLGTQEVPLNCTSESVCCQCVANVTVSVPPMSEMLIPARIDGDTTDNRWLLLEPENISLSHAGILVGKTLVDIRHKEVPVRVLNLANQSHQICKGTTLACCQPVLSVEAGQEQGLTDYPEQLPGHLETLYDRAAASLTSEQKTQLRNLLLEFANLFSEGSYDLGSASSVEHIIDTGNASPIPLLTPM